MRSGVALLIAIAAVLSACSPMPTPTSAIGPLPPASVSPPQSASPDTSGTLVVRQSRIAGGFYIEGAIAYVEVTDESGAEVERFEDPEYHLAKEIARVTLPAGRYEVATYVRPCEAACPRLDGPTDRCELTVDLAAAGTVEVLVQRQVGQPCNATTVAMPATPGTSPLTSLRLTTEFREHCGSIGGCAAYVALMPAGVSEAIEAELTGQGSDEHALPALIAPGSYTVRFRLAALSDDRQVGAPAEEATIATCELPIEVLTQAAVNITVIFDRNSCEANATYTIVIVD